MKNILLAYDDSDASAPHALERASAFAKAFGAKLVVTSVTPVHLGAPRSSGPFDPSEREHHAEELAGARAHLEQQGVNAEYVTGTGEPADAIVALAEKRGSDLIILGTHGRNFVERMLGMSVSDAVAHKSHTDVLIVH